MQLSKAYCLKGTKGITQEELQQTVDPGSSGGCGVQSSVLGTSQAQQRPVGENPEATNVLEERGYLEARPLAMGAHYAHCKKHGSVVYITRKTGLSPYPDNLLFKSCMPL